MKSYKVELDEPQIVPALDYCYLVVKSIEIFPLSKIIHYHGTMYEIDLDNGRLIEKSREQIMQISLEVDAIFDGV